MDPSQGQRWVQLGALALLVALALAVLRPFLVPGGRGAEWPLVREWGRQIPWIGPLLAERVEAVLAAPAALRGWVSGQAGPWAQSIAGMVGGLARNLAGAGVALLSLFFLYRHGDALLTQIQRVARRLAGQRLHAMFGPLGETVRAVMYGMLL